MLFVGNFIMLSLSVLIYNLILRSTIRVLYSKITKACVIVTHNIPGTKCYYFEIERNFLQKSSS